LTTTWRPPKPRLHDRTRVRRPQAPLRNGRLNYAANVFLEKLQARTPPPSLASFIEKKNRANRSDGLESIWAVVYCLLAFTSLKSYRIGYRQPRDRWRHDLVGVTVAKIAQWCGLDKSTVSHILTLLRRCGYLFGPSEDGVNHINQPCEKNESGGFKHLPAIRRFTFVFFAELGPEVMSLLLAKPAPTAATATVHPSSAVDLINALKDAKGLPDSS
jgi:hypothetical protein